MINVFKNHSFSYKCPGCSHQAHRKIADSETPDSIKEIECWNCKTKISKAPDGSWKKSEVSQ